MTHRQQVITIDNQSWNLVVDHYGTAGDLKSQLDGVKLDALYQKVTTLNNTAAYASGFIGTSLANLKARLAQVWTGQAADQAAAIIAKMTEACDKISANATQTASGLRMGADAITTAKQKMSGYSHVGADVSNVTSALGGGPSQDDQMKPVYRDLCAGLSDSVHAMPHQLTMPVPLGDSHATPGPTPGPSSPGGLSPGGLGPGGVTPGHVTPGHVTPPPSNVTPGHVTPGHVTPGHVTPGHVTPGPTPGPVTPGGIGPGGISPGGIGPGGISPGGIGPGGISPGGYGPGGYGPGAAIDTGSQLAGFDGSGGGLGAGGGGLGAGGGGLGAGGGGLGAGGGELGAGSGLSSTAGLGGSGAGGGGIGAAGAGAAGAGGRGMGMMPMAGGGQGGNGQDRERSTWLAEDEDVWGGDDAPPGVIA